MPEPNAFRLCRWRDDHRAPFAALHADPEVMSDLGGPFSQADSDAKFDRYRKAWDEAGVSRWALENEAGRFLGYAGIVYRDDPAHPLRQHFEIGWRLNRPDWGKAYVTRAGAAALKHAWGVVEADQIFSYTSPDNTRSQNVMARLNLKREATLDFDHVYSAGVVWRGLVWSTARLEP